MRRDDFRSNIAEDNRDVRINDNRLFVQSNFASARAFGPIDRLMI